jgi:nucleotide-binding universal stress UspA family protein
MKPFASILVPLDGSAMAARSLGCASWLASRLGARLHVLSATSRELPAPEELRRLRVPEAHWPNVHLHQAATFPPEAILRAIDEHRADVVVMTARGAAAEAGASGAPDLVKTAGHVTESVLERSRVPVLLLPSGYTESLPWRRVLVPVSGGAESDCALALSVRLADAIDLAVYVAHVTDGGAALDEGLGARTRYADAMHHEYAGQLEEVVARALPELTAGQCRAMRPVVLGRGPIAGELVRLIHEEAISALSMGWHGHLGAGRAEVLKQLLPVLDVPVLLVRSEAGAPFRLKVGEELE